MSNRDEEILKLVNLTHGEAAASFGVTRQAVSKGISNPEVHYLGIDRVRKLHRYLKSEGRTQNADDLLAFVEEVFPLDEVHLLRRERLETIPDDPALTTDFAEMWILTARPRELEELGYLQGMLAPHLFKDESKKFEYFLPPGDASVQFSAMLEHIPRTELAAQITVFRCRAMELVPHYVLMDPKDKDLHRGYVLADGHELLRMRDVDTTRLVFAIERLKRETRTDSGLELEVVFTTDLTQSTSLT